MHCSTSCWWIYNLNLVKWGCCHVPPGKFTANEFQGSWLFWILLNPGAKEFFWCIFCYSRKCSLKWIHEMHDNSHFLENLSVVHSKALQNQSKTSSHCARGKERTKNQAEASMICPFIWWALEHGSFLHSEQLFWPFMKVWRVFVFSMRLALFCR